MIDRRRGATLLETIVGLTLLTMTLIGSVSLFIGGLRSFEGNSTKVYLSEKNAQGLRRVAETLSDAINIAVSVDGKTVTYNMPKTTDTVDAITGEKEYTDPLTSDGVSRTFLVDTSGNLTDGTSRSFVKQITSTDPDSSSSTYGQTYRHFSLTQVGSTKAVTINFITLQRVNGKNQFARMKTTVMLHNSK